MTEPTDAALTGKSVLVTGATDGIGLHTARALAGRGAQVIITGRTERRGMAAVANIDGVAGRPAATFVRADHSTVGGNQLLADQIRTDFGKLDILINNVGGLFGSRRETTDGYEATLAMNFVGPFALTAALLPLLRAHPPGRCIFVVSAGFKMYKGDPFHDLQATQDYVPAHAYNRSKLLNLLASLALGRQLPTDEVVVNAVHPGMAWTSMTQSMTPQTMPIFRYIWPVVRLAQRCGSPKKAGRRVAQLAAIPGATCPGGYFEGGTTPQQLSTRESGIENQQLAWRLVRKLISEAPTCRNCPVTGGSGLGIGLGDARADAAVEGDREGR